jgi:hypothetical protein
LKCRLRFVDVCIFLFLTTLTKKSPQEIVPEDTKSFIIWRNVILRGFLSIIIVVVVVIIVINNSKTVVIVIVINNSIFVIVIIVFVVVVVVVRSSFSRREWRCGLKVQALRSKSEAGYSESRFQVIKSSQLETKTRLEVFPLA